LGSTVLATSLFGEVAAALGEHGSAALDEHRSVTAITVNAL
jgi:hypothetical protein